MVNYCPFCGEGDVSEYPAIDQHKCEFCKKWFCLEETDGPK